MDGPSPRPVALTREDLDTGSCGEPGCDHTSHPEGLYLHGVCHPHGSLACCYRDGMLVFHCSECGSFVARVLVAARLIH